MLCLYLYDRFFGKLRLKGRVFLAPSTFGESGAGGRGLSRGRGGGEGTLLRQLVSRFLYLLDFHFFGDKK